MRLAPAALSFLLVLGPIVARAADPVVPEARSDAAAVFDAARRAYLLGDVDGAREGFLELVTRAGARGDVPDALLAEAYVFLGEIAWLAGQEAAADDAFRLALDLVPDLRLSSYEHPMEIIGAFELVRSARLRRPPEPPPLPPRPMPWWGYAPFGVPQFGQARPARGATYATLQVLAAGSSVAAWVWIDRLQVPRDGGGLDLSLQQQRARRARIVRDAMSIPSAVAFYGVWAASIGDSAISWRRDQAGPAPPQVSVVPWTHGPGVQVGVRF